MEYPDDKKNNESDKTIYKTRWENQINNTQSLLQEQNNACPLVVAKSQKMKEFYTSAFTLAQTPFDVLIEGYPGTGKNVLAQIMQQWANMGNKPFIHQSCADISENLVESELFGHTKGSFTGAVDNKKGIVTKADGGILFLDEFNSIPLTIQGKFLRFLQKKTFRKVGSIKDESVNVRVFGATNQNLNDLVAQGTFRKDLLQRISGHLLLIPPLWERKEDIPDLAKLFMKKQFGTEYHFEEQALEYLQNRDWPENVRELKQFIETLFVYQSLLENEKIITLEFVEYINSTFHKNVESRTKNENRKNSCETHIETNNAPQESSSIETEIKKYTDNVAASIAKRIFSETNDTQLNLKELLRKIPSEIMVAISTHRPENTKKIQVAQLLGYTERALYSIEERVKKRKGE